MDQDRDAIAEADEENDVNEEPGQPRQQPAEVEPMQIGYGAVAASDVDVAPPAGTTVVDLSGLVGGDPNSSTTSEPTGLPADFPFPRFVLARRAIKLSG